MCVGRPATIRTPIGGSGIRSLAIRRPAWGWLGALDLNQVPKIQSLVSCRLDERRMNGTAGAIRTPVLDRRRVALSSSELQPYVWLPEAVSNHRHPLCKSGALPSELSGKHGSGGPDSNRRKREYEPRVRPPPPHRDECGAARRSRTGGLDVGNVALCPAELQPHCFLAWSALRESNSRRRVKSPVHDHYAKSGKVACPGKTRTPDLLVRSQPLCSN